MAGRERIVGLAAVVVLIIGIFAAIARHDDSDDDVATGSDSASTTTTRPTTSTGGTLAPGTTPPSSAVPDPTAGSASTSAAPTTPPPTDPEPEPEPTAPVTPVPRGDLAAVRVRLTAVASLASPPIAGAARPNAPGWLYVGTRTGQVHLVHPDGTTDQLLDISGETTTDGERGLLGIAVSADGGAIAVSFTDKHADHANRLDRFSLDGNGFIVAATRQHLLSVPHPQYSNHNGGGVVFGPDGALYWGLGDGGGAGDPLGNAQNLGTFRGKLVRVDPSSGQGSVLHYGLRNPWRFSFDRATSDLWIADVGQDAWEEIDWLPAGSAQANFGWNLREGLHPYKGGGYPPGNVDPIFEYPTAPPNCSITGGYVYRGQNIPNLIGAYLFSDFCGGEIHALASTSGHVELERFLGISAQSVVSFAEDSAGELYVLSLAGQVYRIDAA